MPPQKNSCKTVSVQKLLQDFLEYSVEVLVSDLFDLLVCQTSLFQTDEEVLAVACVAQTDSGVGIGFVYAVLCQSVGKDELVSPRLWILRETDGK